jgi:hypothetical protein
MYKNSYHDTQKLTWSQKKSKKRLNISPSSLYSKITFPNKFKNKILPSHVVQIIPYSLLPT